MQIPRDTSLGWVTRLESEFGTKTLYQVTNVFEQCAEIFTKLLGLYFVGSQKKHPAKFPPNFPRDFPANK